MSMLVVMPRVLTEKLGPEGADALADLLAKASVARTECEVCKKNIDTKFNEVLQEIRATRDELRAEIRAECARVRAHTFAWTFSLTVALFAALAAFLK